MYINEINNAEMKIIYKGQQNRKEASRIEKIMGKKILIKKVYYKTPHAMWRFYGYYGGLNVVGNFHNYGQYADDSSFQVIPAWHNKMQAVTYEDHLYTRTSHYSFEILDISLKLKSEGILICSCFFIFFTCSICLLI